MGVTLLSLPERQSPFTAQHKSGGTVAVTGTRRADPASPRTANLAAVLRALRTGPLSRTQLAARCGVAKSAVPGLLAELADRGLVRPAGVLPGNGRPSRLVELDGEDTDALAL